MFLKSFFSRHCNHSSCGKCVLFSNTEEDDRRARREAAASMESEGITASDVGLASPDMKAGAQIKKNHQNQPPALLQLNINAHQQPRDNLADQYQALHGDEVPAGGACIVM